MSGYSGSGGYGFPQSGGGYPGGGYPGGGYPGGGYPGGQPMGGYPAGQPVGGYPGPPSNGYPRQQGCFPNQRPPGASYGYPNMGAGPQVDPNIAMWFNAVDQDKSGQITSAELQRALVNGNWSNFSEEACRFMIDTFDKNKSGTIGIHEFGELFNFINMWKGHFESIDRDRSGFIEFNELSSDCYDKDSSGTIGIHEFGQLFNSINQWKSVFEAMDLDKSGLIEEAELARELQRMGYRFSETFIKNLLNKYDHKNKRLSLDNFIIVMVQIKRLTGSFQIRDVERKGIASMAYEDFVGLAMGIHQ